MPWIQPWDFLGFGCLMYHLLNYEIKIFCMIFKHHNKLTQAVDELFVILGIKLKSVPCYLTLQQTSISKHNVIYFDTENVTCLYIQYLILFLILIILIYQPVFFFLIILMCCWKKPVRHSILCLRTNKIDSDYLKGQILFNHKKDVYYVFNYQVDLCNTCHDFFYKS